MEAIPPRQPAFFRKFYPGFTPEARAFAGGAILNAGLTPLR